MKFKNVLLTGLSFVLIAVVAIGGTLAYLTSEDSDVNVMTLGNVSIEQHEYERVANADGTYATKTIDNVTSYVLKDFTQAKPLLPSAIDTTTWEGWDWDSTVVRMTQVDSYGGMQVFKAASNAQDKFVIVENTGDTDAYIRTLVAIEIGSTDGSLIGTSYHSTWTDTDFDPSTTDVSDPLYIQIDGKNYMLQEYIYAGGQLSDGSWRHGNGILPAGDTSYPNLSQVYIRSEATNEDMKAIDGNGNGTLDILVLSQAVQAKGFADAKTALDTAFGAITTTSHPWSDTAPVIPAAVSDADGIATAMNNGGTAILTKDVSAPLAYSAIYGTPVAVVQKNGGVIDGNGYSLDIENPKYNGYAIETWGGTIKNLTVDTAVGRGIVISSPKEDVYIDNVVIDGPGYAINTTEHNGKNLVVTNSTVNGWTSLAGLDYVEFNNCIFGENSSKYWQNMGYDQDYDRLVKPYVNTEFNSCKFNQGFYIDLSALENGCAVTINNCTTTGTKLTANNYQSYISIELPTGRTLADCVIFK